MTKTQSLRSLLSKQWISPLTALKHCGPLSLSQRVGDLRRSGVKVADRWVESEGARFKEYRIGKR